MTKKEMIKLMADAWRTYVRSMTEEVNGVDLGMEKVLEAQLQAGMLPPRRDDESPTGYGAAYLDDDQVNANYFKFKHSWESEDD